MLLQGLEDAGLVQAALLRPQTGYYNDIIEEAAALWESLTMNHGFVDGNKRVAFFATDVFLRLNGFKIDVEPEPAHAFLEGHAGGMEDGITDFWQFHVYPSGGSWDTGSPFDNRVVAEYGYDLPVIVGEFPAQVWEQTNNGVPLPNDETTEEMVSP